MYRLRYNSLSCNKTTVSYISYKLLLDVRSYWIKNCRKRDTCFVCGTSNGTVAVSKQRVGDVLHTYIHTHTKHQRARREVKQL
jgi:hypothetical protein